MDYFLQRRLGLHAANAAKASRTASAIRDKDSCFDTILNTAAQEMGTDALVKQILQHSPEWAYQTLCCVPNLGAHREALVAKATESPDWALETLRFVPNLGDQEAFVREKAGVLANSIGEVSGFSLFNNGGFVCQFTIFWQATAGTEPEATVPKSEWDYWHWSGNILLGQSSGTINVQNFAINKQINGKQVNISPKTGNQIWMFMWVQAGTDKTSSLRFTYNPNTSSTATFTASGTTTSPSLSLDSVS